MGFICHNFDPVDLVTPQRFMDFFQEVTGRHDIVFKKIATPTHWK